ncbi:MAG: hypothetical protein AAGD06_29400 [Acidobacteriota bacterium]
MPTRLLSTLICVLAINAWGPAAWADWGHDALRHQEKLDILEPLNQSLWVGTHNSYNARNWDSAYVDPNQSETPRTQLENGVRELTFDVHEYAGQLRLCHGLCFGGEKKFRKGLEEIRGWLVDGNMDSVVLLKLEVDKNLGQTADQLEAELGEYIFKPTPGQISIDGHGPSCHGLEPQFLSKAEVLKWGKNVVVVRTSHGCPSNSSFKKWVHIGLEYHDEVNPGDHGFQKKFKKLNSPSECESYSGSQMTRVFDPNTLLQIGAQGAMEITENNVDNYLRCGLNIFEMFFFDSEILWPLESEDLVWSWKRDRPRKESDGGGDRDCAVLLETDLRFEDRICSNSHQFACYSPLLDRWQVTNALGPWSDGEAACADEFGWNPYGGGYSFAVPTGVASKRQLVDELSDGEAVWINYHDRSIEGVWQPNNGSLYDLRQTQLDGDQDGRLFSDKNLVFEDIYTGRGDWITAVHTSLKNDRVSGLRISRISGGTHLYGKQEGTDQTFNLSYGEGVTQVRHCYNGRGDEIRGITFTTNWGRSHSVGSSGSWCRTHTSSGSQDRLVGLEGYEGSNGRLKALSYFFREGGNFRTVVDNSQSRFSTVGGWGISSDIPGYRGDHYTFTSPGNGSNEARWTAWLPSAGYYKVYARWPETPNQASRVEYVIPSANGLRFVIVDPSAYGSGGRDNLLGTFYMNTGQTTVTLDNEADGTLMVDSVTFERVAD